jgi:hypothetical protein
MTRRLAIAALLLWAATVSTLALLFVRGSTMPATDGRTAIRLSAGERDFVLGEMRGMLAAIQQITAALAEGDTTKAGEAAAAVGLKAAHGVPPTLMAKLPLDFKRAGIGTHQGFDDFAAAAERGAGAAALTGRLAQQMNACVGCHAGYRFVAE